MLVKRRRYVVDTSVYIDALRSEQARASLTAFLTASTPFIWLSAVVVQELRAGARGHSALLLDSRIIAPFERRNRIVTPTYAAWKQAGRVLSELIGPREWSTVSRSFVNDVLLAESCRESGFMLVTNNVRDFARIADVRPFDFTSPWPGMA